VVFGLLFLRHTGSCDNSMQMEPIMLSNFTLVLSGLGIGSLLTLVAKSVLDKRQYRFSKVFEYKERRYQAILILMWTAMSPTDSAMENLQLRRPEIKNKDDLQDELQLEYHNAMLFASDAVLTAFDRFIRYKTSGHWKLVARAMKKDLYI
jgi:hypothetical protein